MATCPNKNLPEWKALEKAQPKLANFLWDQYDGNVPEKFYSNANRVANPVINKADVVLPIGTSGSGKSTWIKSVNANNQFVVISPDDMRVEFTGDMNDKSKDAEIYKEAANRAIQAIKEGRPVIFDTTNLTKDKRRPFINAIKKAIPSANIQYKLMALDAELAKQRIKADIAAGVNRANVSEETIDRHAASYKQMLEDIKSEGITNYDVNPSQTINNEKAKTWLAERFPDLSVTFLDAVANIGNGTGHGYVQNSAMFLYSGAEIGSEYHEAYHIVHRSMLNDAQRILLLEEARVKYGKPSKEELDSLNELYPGLPAQEIENLFYEEKLAEDFRDYTLSEGAMGRSLPERIAKWFQTLWSYIKMSATDHVTIKDVFRVVEGNKIPAKFFRNTEKFNPDQRVYRYRQEYGEEATREITSTLSKFLIDRKDVPGFEIETAIGKGANKGDIANYFLMNAYSTPQGNAVSLDVAQKAFEVESAYYKAVKSGDQARIAEATANFSKTVAELGGVQFKRPLSFTDQAPLLRNIFFDVYNNWNTTLDAEFGNVKTIGWRELLAEDMRNFGMIVRSNEETLDFEDDDGVIEKIYGKSSFESNPADGLTGRVKEILSRVESTEANFLGYNTYLPKDEVYIELLNAFAGAKNFQTMLARAENLVRFKPKYANVIPLLTGLTAADQAAVRSAFSLNQNKFLLFVEDKTETGATSKVINSNEKSVERAEVTLWKNNSVEVQIVKPRALYKYELDADKNLVLTVKKDKAKLIAANFLAVQDAIRKGEEVASEKGISTPVMALAKVMWNMSMNIGDSTVFDQTAHNLQKYFNTGVTVNQNNRLVFLKGKELFAYYVNRPNHELSKLVTKVINLEFEGKNIKSYKGPKENPTNIFGAGGEQKTIRHLASIVPLFKSNKGTSFTNGMNSAVYDMNLPTSLDTIVTTLTSGTPEAAKMWEMLLADPFNNPNPLTNNKYTGLILRLLQNPLYRSKFTNFVYDSSKGEKDFIAFTDYSSFNNADSLVTRLNAYINNANRDDGLNQIPTQGDRSRLDIAPFPRSRKLTATYGIQMSQEDIIASYIIQDLARIAKAKNDLQNAPMALLSEGYHYSTKEDASGKFSIAIRDAKGKLTGRAFDSKFFQFDGKLNGIQIATDLNIPDSSPDADKLYPNGTRHMSDMVTDFLNGRLKEQDPDGYAKFNSALKDMIDKSTMYFTEKATEVKAKIVEYGVGDRLGMKQIEELGGLELVLRDFAFDDFVARNEFTRIFRGSRAHSKDLNAFYKRMASLTTPSVRLAEQGEIEAEEPGVSGQYGMTPTYTSAVIRDNNLRTTPTEEQKHVKQATDLEAGMVSAGIDPKTAKEIAQSFNPTVTKIEGTDGQGFASIDMYRKYKEGKGQWFSYHEDAFQEYKRAQAEGRPAIFAFQATSVLPKGVKAGDRITVEPIKPYFEGLHNINNNVVPINEKNSWRVLLEEGTKGNSTMNDLRQRMEKTGDYANNPDIQPIDIVNVESARKFHKSSVYQITGTQGEFTNLYVETLNSAGLGFPQEIADTGKQKAIINRQLKKNAIANVNKNAVYKYNSGIKGKEVAVKGEDLLNFFHEATENMANLAIKSLFQELGLDGIIRAKKSTSPQRFQEEYAARLKALQTIRDILEKENLDRKLPTNYDDALTIVVDKESGMPRFAIPLDFPVYQTKFQQVLFGMFNNQVFKQKALGIEAVQFAEFGGSEEDSTLNFYAIKTDNEGKPRLAHMEVMIREDLARNFGIEPGQSLEDIPEELRRMIGYRIPNQDKSSTVLIKIKGFLPKGYAKAVKVPAQITKLMGSDFDVDKLLILAPYVNKGKDGKIEKVSIDYNKAIAEGTIKNAVPEGMKAMEAYTNTILDTIEAVMASPLHFTETLRPLDEESLSNIMASLIMRNPSLVSSTEFASPMKETEIAERAIIGNTLKGLWNNVLSGRNVAAAGTIVTTNEYAISLDNVRYKKHLEKVGTEPIGVQMQLPNGQATTIQIDNNIPTSTIIGRYVSAAVDAANKPKQYELNDRTITLPVEAYWINFVGDTVAMHDFLNQPIIRHFTNVYFNKYGGDLLEINNAYADAMREFKLTPLQDINKYEMLNMNRKDLANITRDDKKNITQGIYMNNFMKLHRAGSQLMELYQTITPDTADGMNSIDRIEAYKDKRAAFDDKSGAQAFRGPDGMSNPVDQFLGDDSIYGTQKAYDRMSDAAMEMASLLFPANTSPAFKTFKENLKLNIGEIQLSPEQHRDISRNLNLRLLITPRVISRDSYGDTSQIEESPLADFFSKEHIEKTYLSKDTNIDKRLDEMKAKYPALIGNKFISNLARDEKNDEPEARFFTIKFDNSYGFSRTEKDMFTAELRKLLYSPEKYASDPANPQEIKEIKEFAEDVTAHAIVSRGFDIGANSFADVVPVEFWTSPRTVRYGRNAGKVTTKSPVDFFMTKVREVQNSAYLNDEIFNFIRSNAFMRHGKKTLLRKKNVKTLADKVTVDGVSNNFVLLVEKASREVGLYTKASSTEYGGVYARVQTLGATKRLVELSGESVINPPVGAVTSVDSGSMVLLKDARDEGDDSDSMTFCVMI